MGDTTDVRPQRDRPGPDDGRWPSRRRVRPGSHSIAEAVTPGDL